MSTDIGEGRTPERASRPRPGIRRRAIAGVLLIATIGAGLLVYRALPGTAATDIAGDALYAVAAYLAVVLVAPRLPPLVVGGIAAAWCTAVELFQLTGLPLVWGAQFAPVTLVLGTVFDTRDLVVYLVTIALATALDAGLHAVRHARR
ncbi:DUF2809 domain-containing protein [Microbacterium sp. B35-30]|uniref:DUF2809 domain-containing protein n=1 Tax=Microbacterium sp. B35-30 TaxID=1962642 RepID=UPI001EF98B80|nr:DUF2809 domain-containing protein [Microbacterium sp. B35-30]